MYEFLLISLGMFIAAVVFSQNKSLTFVSKDLHVKYEGFTYKMTKVED